MRSLAMSGIVPEELDRLFPEFRPFLGKCFYADCHHMTEPGCKVTEAVKSGLIPKARYDSYASLRRGDTC